MINKKFTYLLMVCVTSVWGIIFYRIFLRLIAEDDLPASTLYAVKDDYFKMIDHQDDVVLLNLNYRDPFTEQLAASENIIYIEPLININRTKPPKMPKPQINWSSILYTGYINNPSTKKKIAILLIDGKECLLSEGQSANGLQLVSYEGDSVKVKYQNVFKYISIK